MVTFHSVPHGTKVHGVKTVLFVWDLVNTCVLVDLLKSRNVTQLCEATGYTAVSNQRYHGAVIVPHLLRFPGLFLTSFVSVTQHLQQMPFGGETLVFSKAVVKVWRERSLHRAREVGGGEGSLTCLCIVHEGMESF